MKLSACLLLLSLSMVRCSGNQPMTLARASGEFSVLTYNVAGLPQGISPSNPQKNIPLISTLLNQYNIALVQEDFYYHEQLRANAQHPYKSTPKAPADQFIDGDGLNRFSVYPFRNFLREPWQHCANKDGNDCMAQKGFSAAETEIAAGIVVDIYNLHLDSGSSSEDFTARDRQIEQLIRRVKARSSDNAIILMGDTNLHTESRPRDAALLDSMLHVLQLTDACRDLGCGEEHVDRVLFRSSNTLSLTPTSWQLDPDFVDPQGHSLSDHPAISVTFQWDFQPN